LVGELRQHFADYKYVSKERKNLQWNYGMECNIKEIGEQIVKSSNGKSVLRARVKNLPTRKHVTLLLLKSMGIAEPTCRVTGKGES
jgi:hypothetical protein